MLSQLHRRMMAVFGATVRVACPASDAEAIKRATNLIPVEGPEEDVLTRMLNVLDATGAEVLVRVTADCPIMPPDLIYHGLKEYGRTGRVVQNWRPRCHPDGFDFDIWPSGILRNLGETLEGPDREWFAQAYLDARGESLHIGGNPQLARLRLTVDHQEDLDLMRALYEEQGEDIWQANRIIEWCMRNPKLMKTNQKYVKDFGARPR